MHKFLDSMLKFQEKKTSLSLHLVQKDSDPDQQDLDADPDPGEDPDPQHCFLVTTVLKKRYRTQLVTFDSVILLYKRFL